MIQKIILLQIIAGGILLTSCRPCNPEIIDRGNLTVEENSLIPYQNDDVLNLTHNSGFEIHFSCFRETVNDTEYCDECCDYQIRYQREIIRLTPDYPIFMIEFSIDNAQETFIDYSCSIAQDGYHLPYSYPMNMKDSLLINGNTYYDVFCLKSSDYGYGYSQDSIRPDSLYINKADGILKITMTNGEYYVK